MTDRLKHAGNMIYTPNSHIPIGEAVRLPDGSHAIRVKNPRTKEIDEIPMDHLLEEVITKTAEIRIEQKLAVR